MNEALRLVAATVQAYLLGGFCAAYYLVRWKTGADIRAIHSGTAGARNAGRVLGKFGFLVVLVLDMAKGALAVWLAQVIAPETGSWPSVARMLALVGAVLGHRYPLQLDFRGGKSVAVGIGAITCIEPLIALGLAALAGFLFLATSRNKRIPLLAGALLPPAVWVFSDDLIHQAGLTLAAALILFFHRRYITLYLKNLKRRPHEN